MPCLRDCPSSPNCVCSDAGNDSHRVDPLLPLARNEEAWLAIIETVASLPRTRIVTRSADYLHAECKSPVFGFIDDLELQLRTEDGLVAVRSAARTGYYDFGVNRRRIARLRAQLAQRGIVA